MVNQMFNNVPKQIFFQNLGFLKIFIIDFLGEIEYISCEKITISFHQL